MYVKRKIQCLFKISKGPNFYFPNFTQACLQCSHLINILLEKKFVDDELTERVQNKKKHFYLKQFK